MSTTRLYSPTSVVNKIIGPIFPIGESNADNDRFENLQEMCELVEELLSYLHQVRTEKNAHEYSVKRAGQYADNFLTTIGITE